MHPINACAVYTHGSCVRGRILISAYASKISTSKRTTLKDKMQPPTCCQKSPLNITSQPTVMTCKGQKSKQRNFLMWSGGTPHGWLHRGAGRLLRKPHWGHARTSPCRRPPRLPILRGDPTLQGRPQPQCLLEIRGGS